MNILIAVGDLSSNSLGRAYCLWLLAKELHWQVRVAGIGEIWPVLSDTEFAEICVDFPSMSAMASWSDVIIAYAILPETFGAVKQLGKPVIVDVDEPHWEQRYGFNLSTQGKVLLRRIIDRKNPLTPFLERRLVKRAHIPVMISNPSLSELYPNSMIVPHVRAAHTLQPMPKGQPTVAFVGTPRRHKGLEVLRRAAAAAAVELVITADRPEDALENERWVGITTLEEGRRLILDSHAVGVLSDEAGEFSSRQLPVKAIDAMLAGRIVIASNTEPLRWVTGGTGIMVRAGNEEEVVAAFRSLHQTGWREKRGAAAYEWSVARYTPEAVAPAFEEVVRRAKFEFDSERRGGRTM